MTSPKILFSNREVRFGKIVSYAGGRHTGLPLHDCDIIYLKIKSVGYARIDIFNLIVETKLAFDSKKCGRFD
jgi:hypothetical protein